jgi:hypothetical protein
MVMTLRRRDQAGREWADRLLQSVSQWQLWSARQEFGQGLEWALCRLKQKPATPARACGAPSSCQPQVRSMPKKECASTARCLETVHLVGFRACRRLRDIL